MNTRSRNSALFILGMHRSGTSALTGVLSLLGVDPGPSLSPGMAGVNPKGFWEHQEIVTIHERLLGALDSSWDDARLLPADWWQLPEVTAFRSELLAVLRRDFTTSPLWLLKDPRLCRLLPLWLDIIDELGIAPHFILCLRHPNEVAMSLSRRDGISTEHATLLWLEHLVESEHSTRILPRVLVTYEQLLTDWRTTLERIAAQLDLNLRVDAAAAGKIDIFLESSLRHHRHASAKHSGNGRVFLLANRAFDLAAHHDISLTSDQFDALQEEIAATANELAPWSSEICTLKNSNSALELKSGQLEATNAGLEAEILRIKNTVSWRITKPLRFLAFLRHKIFP